MSFCCVVMLSCTHLIVSDQQQAHQRSVEDRLGNVSCLSLEAFLRHQGSAQGLTRPLHIDTARPWHPALLVNLKRVYQGGGGIPTLIQKSPDKRQARWVRCSFFTCRVKGEQDVVVVRQLCHREYYPFFPGKSRGTSFTTEGTRTGLICE